MLPLDLQNNFKHLGQQQQFNNPDNIQKFVCTSWIEIYICEVIVNY